MRTSTNPFNNKGLSNKSDVTNNEGHIGSRVVVYKRLTKVRGPEADEVLFYGGGSRK
jgi:hypothetical protein